jgi:hypothetical protein
MNIITTTQQVYPGSEACVIIEKGYNFLSGVRNLYCRGGERQI